VTPPSKVSRQEKRGDLRVLRGLLELLIKHVVHLLLPQPRVGFFELRHLFFEVGFKRSFETSLNGGRDRHRKRDDAGEMARSASPPRRIVAHAERALTSGCFSIRPA
jgi:hypothetical protein